MGLHRNHHHYAAYQGQKIKYPRKTHVVRDWYQEINFLRVFTYIVILCLLKLNKISVFRDSKVK